VSAPGVYLGMPEAQYHSSPGVSCSILKRFAEAPAKAHVGRGDTDALRAGRVTHHAILEPHRFEALYAVTDMDRRGTRAWQDAEAEAFAAGQTLLKRAEYDDARALRDAVLAHPTARQMLAPPLQTEVSAYWTDADTGLACRMRADGVRADDALVLDVKTAQDASPEGFSRAAATWRYHWQAAFYMAGLAAAPGGFRPERFLFIAVEKAAPFLVGVYELAFGAAEQGEREVRAALREYAACKARGIWPGYSADVVQLELPAWAVDEQGIAA
jgi:hypothetical protein